MTVDEAVNQATEGYERRVAQFVEAHGDLIAEVVAEVEAVGMDALSDFFYDITDEVKDGLGADASNLLESEDEQEEALDQAEGWVADNVSNAGVEANVLAAIWSRNMEAVNDIRAELAAVTKPKA